MTKMGVFLALVAIAAVFILGWGTNSAFNSPDDGSLITGAAVGLPVNSTAWTKAICDEDNFCIDVIITCEDGNVVDLVPIADGVNFSADWEDPRSDEFRKEFC